MPRPNAWLCDSAGKTLARTSTTVAVISGGQAAITNLPLRISEFRQWDVRIEVSVEDQLLVEVQFLGGLPE